MKVLRTRRLRKRKKVRWSNDGRKLLRRSRKGRRNKKNRLLKRRQEVAKTIKRGCPISNKLVKTTQPKERLTDLSFLIRKNTNQKKLTTIR